MHHHTYHRGSHDSIRNGMPSRDLGTQGWSKPWSDDVGGACVEAKKLSDGRVALRQSTDPDGPALVFTPHEMISFLTGVKAGDADFLL
ncbi:DUF397 domain-containing protein [Streptomyces spongiae]|uniref:DUF397 domain-containing protein n=1 Tax=Streptomyces spongiae TaxID=565072 RepID=A0A5N8XPG4_9ACTN|nr:DUF397 domain-containing protein [Streptomyces spongiae]MPY61292.1 DUF397 domain-containing protein [Streptomyces spongiae]